MKYNGYLIEEENTGISPKNAKFYFHIIDEEIVCGYGENLEDCQKQIDELIKDVVSICNRS